MERSVVSVLEAMIARSDAVTGHLANAIQLLKSKSREPEDRSGVDEDDYDEYRDSHYRDYQRGGISHEQMVERYMEDGIGLDQHEVEALFPDVERGGGDEDSFLDMELSSEAAFEYDLIDTLSDWRSAREILTKIRMASILGRSEWLVLHHDESSGLSIVISSDCRTKISVDFTLGAWAGRGEYRELTALLDTFEPLLDEVRIPADYIRKRLHTYYCPEMLRARMLTELPQRVSEDYATGTGVDHGVSREMAVVIIDGCGAESGFSDAHGNPDNACVVAITGNRGAPRGNEAPAPGAATFGDAPI